MTFTITENDITLVRGDYFPCTVSMEKTANLLLRPPDHCGLRSKSHVIKDVMGIRKNMKTKILTIYGIAFFVCWAVVGYAQAKITAWMRTM